MGKTKRRLHDRKTGHLKAVSKNGQTSAIADHITSTGHNIKWDHFEILATGRSDIHCRTKESLLIKDLKPSLNMMRMWVVRNFFFTSVSYIFQLTLICLLSVFHHCLN